jgi:phosphatidylserine/phosphatidylglycerophosphate/cardiolipin synthase-like enzyme
VHKLSAVAAFMTLSILPIAGVSGSAPAAPSPAPAAAISGSATFNVPRPYGDRKANFAIVNRVQRAIENTPGKRPGKPRQIITIATYLMDRTSTVTALIQACKRGVAVRVILDEEISNRNSRRLISTLNGDNVRDRNHDGKADSPPTRRRCNRPLRTGRTGDRTVPGERDDGMMSMARIISSVDAPMKDSITWGKDGSYVKRCKPSCRTNSGNMHMKIFLFSRTGGASHVVMVSSSNLNRGGAQLGWNDMYVMKNRPESYFAYKNVHRAMTAGKPAPRNRIQIVDGPFTSRFFPILDAGIHKDPVMSDLSKVKCRSAFGPTQIHISMFYWKGRRGNYIADKLLSLARHGCRISIIYGAPSRQIAQRLREAAVHDLISVYDSRWDYNDDGFNEVRTHSKFVLVRGNYKGNPKKWVVMTGSPNWVAGSLSKGDESTLNIELKSAYVAYRNNWEKIRKHSRKVPFN